MEKDAIIEQQTELIQTLEARIKELETANLAVGSSQHSVVQVLEFHQFFGHPISTDPVIPSFEFRKLRINLILEELGEFIAASGFMCTTVYQIFDALERYLKNIYEWQIADAPKPDIVEAADALGDIDYVVAGANIVWGLPAEAIAREIHRSNMSKLGANGKPVFREDGKILKGPNYFKPRIRAILYPEEAIEQIEIQQGVTAGPPGKIEEEFPKNPQSAHHP